MTITPQAFPPFINKALDGIVGIAEVLGAVKALHWTFMVIRNITPRVTYCCIATRNWHSTMARWS